MQDDFFARKLLRGLLGDRTLTNARSGLNGPHSSRLAPRMKESKCETGSSIRLGPQPSTVPVEFGRIPPPITPGFGQSLAKMFKNFRISLVIEKEEIVDDFVCDSFSD
jgi:hypothetical protein